MPEPSFIFSTPPNSERMFYFTVSAYDAAGNDSGLSNEAGVYVDEVAPKAPQGVKITIIVVVP